nr:reverse transcriptase domain-containing protein [Tanacetum cinerariifolium]
MFKRLEKGVFHKLGDKEKNMFAHSRDLRHRSYNSSRRDTESYYRSSRSKEIDFASEKHHNKRTSSRRTEALSKSEDSAGGHWKSSPKRQKSSVEDVMSQPWVCEETYPFTPWICYFDFPKTQMPSHIKTYDESEDPEDHLKIFQAAAKTERWTIKKCIKDPVEIHNIKQRDEESMEDFVRRYKLECRDVKGALECTKISGLMLGITNPELIKRLYDKIPKSVDKMMKTPDKTQTSKREAFGTNKGRSESKTYSPSSQNTKRNLGFRQREVQAPSSNDNPGKLSHLIKEIKQSGGKDQTKVAKKGETLGKETDGNTDGIIMAEGSQTKDYSNFSLEPVIFFPPLGEEERMEGPMIIKAEMGGHFVHSMYVDGGSSSKILYEHSFNRFRPEVRRQMIPTTMLLVGFSGEIIWPLGQISLFVKIGDEEHSTSAWMNFMISSRSIPLECTMVSGPGVPQPVINQVTEEEIQKPADMIEVPRHIAEHKLNIREGCFFVRQKKRGQAPERNKAIYEEVEKLVDAGIMKERLVDKAFQKQIGRNLKVYVDDLVIRSCTEEEVIRDIEETFKTLREINMKLNPQKCTFRMREGTFLGYKVNPGRLKVCPDKVEAVLSLLSPKCLKDVKKLNGKLASLNRFLSKSAKKSLSFFKTLKKSDFQWTAEAKTTFKQIKKSIAKLPMLTAPKEKEELIIYLAAVKEAASAVLMTERDGKQMLIYFVSRALQGPKINYTPMKKLILSLDTVMKDEEVLSDPWILFTDGSSCIDGSGAGLIIANPEGMEFTYGLRFRFDATNNEAEYEALIAGLRIAKRIGVKNLQANVDSRLVANQVNGTHVANEPGKWENKKAYALSKIASTSFAHLSKQVLVEELKEKSIDKKEVLAVVEEEGHTWMTPIHEYLVEGILPEERKKARAIRRKARRYAATDEVLYKKSFLRPWLCCVEPLQANYVLIEIHEGSCSMHAGPRSVVAKSLRSGYYWPTMHTNSRKLTRECKDCQVHRPVPKNLQLNLTPITSPWPLYKWGIDIARPFPKGPGKVKFLIVAIDYFTKWIEAKPMATIIGAQIKNLGITHLKIGAKNYVSASVSPPLNTLKPGLVERVNRSLGEGIKARLDKRRKNWLKEISHVLWVHRTMIKSSNGETPFSLTYGAEVVIPVKIGMPTLRNAEVDVIKNDKAPRVSLDLLEEKREHAAIQEAKSKAKMKKYYNARVHNTSFRPGDLVYRSNEASRAKDGGKLEPK